MACYSKKFKTKEPANKELKTTLIYEVKKRPPLWDETNKYWRNPTVTNDLWHEIGRYFGCPGPAIKQIWKNLRERYLIEITKEVNASKRKCCYKSKWFFYDQMSFLDSNYDKSKSYAWDNNEFSKNDFAEFCDLFDDRAVDCEKKNTHVYNIETDSISDEDLAGPSDKMEETDKQDIKVFVQKKGKKSRTPSKKKGKLDSNSQQVVHVPKEEKKKREKRDKEMQVVPYKKEDKKEKDQQIILSTLNDNLFSKSNSAIKQTVPTFSRDNSPFCELNCEPCCSISKQQLKAQSKISTNKQEPSFKDGLRAKEDAYTNIGFEPITNANHQFLMSLLPYLDELTQSECLETRAQIQCVISEAFRRRQNPCSLFQTGGYAPTDLFRQ